MTTGILLSVREKATRLPGKVLKPLGGCNVTEHLIRRLRASRRTTSVIVATSTDSRDAVLCQLAEAEGVPCFRGSEDDKLVRYRDAAHRHRLDNVVVVDGDDPFVSVEHIDRIIDRLERGDADYVIAGGLPIGATGFGLRTAALEQVCHGKPETNTEVWGSLFTADARFRCISLDEPNPAYQRPDIRMTLDYAEDYRFFTTVVDGLRAEKRGLEFAEIMGWLARHPEAIAINRDVQQAYEAHLRRSAGGAS